MHRWFSLSALVIVIDQITKLYADRALNLHEVIPIIPGFFNFTLAYNQGAAFSFLSDAGGWQRWFLSILAITVSIVLIFWIRRLGSHERWTAAALALILGGAIGNVIDRVFYGHVIDFIQWYYQQYYWPAFNIADSAITLGAVIMIISAFFSNDPESTHDTN